MNVSILSRLLSMFQSAPAAAVVPTTNASRASTDESAPSAYDERVAREIQTFSNQLDVHQLPKIFHYWSHTYLRPILMEFGYAHPEDAYVQEIARQYEKLGKGLRIVSLGAGSGDSEVRMAAMLRARGVHEFLIDCVDINPTMAARCAELAAAAGVTEQVTAHCGDFNRWLPDGEYDVVIANQSLHHVLELEHLLDAIRTAIGATGVFLTCDMIGRNGHLRWPEVMPEHQRFWSELAPANRYNFQLQRMETEFMDWDCSVEGFEGVRAQEVLPLLIERFAFDTFIGWANLTDNFIDRSFGHHLNPDDPVHTAFIDRLHARDEQGLLSGEWKPTHLFAVMRRDAAQPTRYWRNLSPEFSVRQLEPNERRAPYGLHI